MNNKEDTLYCGVREDVIKNAQPKLNNTVLKEWFFHQKERTNIYYKKEIRGEKQPWTNDEILKTYKFVNTKRKWDRETRRLRENVIENDQFSYEEKLLNCFLFRVINKGETFDLWRGGLHFIQENINLSKMREILEKKEKSSPDYVFFSAAYILGSPKVHFGKYLEKREGKEEKNMILRMLKFVYYERENILEGIRKARDQEKVCEFLSDYAGIGKFLSYQMFVDFTYIEEFRFTEHNFVMSGPGCDRGINWIFEDRDGMTAEECLFWFVENQLKIADSIREEWDMNKLFHFLPKGERQYTLMDMENSGACEIDKRCRTLFSGKRPKQRYKGSNISSSI